LTVGSAFERHLSSSNGSSQQKLKHNRKRQWNKEQ
jgi:hypothetical protein